MLYFQYILLKTLSRLLSKQFCATVNPLSHQTQKEGGRGEGKKEDRLREGGRGGGGGGGEEDMRINGRGMEESERGKRKGDRESPHYSYYSYL